jgi:hypothetical protein
MAEPILKIWTIYISQQDGEYIAREFSLDVPTKNVLVAYDLDKLRAQIQQHADHDLIKIPRSESDNPSVIESWI